MSTRHNAACRGTKIRSVVGPLLYKDGYTGRYDDTKDLIIPGRIIVAALFDKPYEDAPYQNYPCQYNIEGIATKVMPIYPTKFIILWRDHSSFAASMINQQQPENMKEAVRVYNSGEEFPPQQVDEVCGPVVVGTSDQYLGYGRLRLESDSFASLSPSILMYSQFMAATGAIVKGEDFLRLVSECDEFCRATPVAK